MNDLPHLLMKARRTALSCAVALALALATLGSVLWYDRSLTQRFTAAEQAHTALEAEQRDLAEDLQAVVSGQSEFLKQQRQGLVGKAEREQWAQSLIAAYQAQQFTGVPEYTLKAPAPFQFGGTGAASGSDPTLAAVAAPASTKKKERGRAAPTAPVVPVVVQTHEIQFNLAQAHEADVLAILSRLQTQHDGVVQLDQCALTEPKPEGLRASCSLKFFNLSRPNATTGVAGAPATVAAAGMSGNTR
jgi:hypothetical protein